MTVPDAGLEAHAVYILDSGDERLLRVNKQDLMAFKEARRIYHPDGWYEARVKRALGMDDSAGSLGEQAAVPVAHQSARWFAVKRGATASSSGPLRTLAGLVGP